MIGIGTLVNGAAIVAGGLCGLLGGSLLGGGRALHCDKASPFFDKRQAVFG